MKMYLIDFGQLKIIENEKKSKFNNARAQVLTKKTNCNKCFPFYTVLLGGVNE